MSTYAHMHEKDYQHLVYASRKRRTLVVALETNESEDGIEERRKRYSQRIVVAIEGNIIKKLKSKEDEIDKIGKLNWALEERVKSLCVENQLWKDLAQKNEATANTLRCNLDQVLAQVHCDQNQRHRADEALAGDAQSVLQ
ncbi:putative BOI-related E3 ubiquitin-protein ligase [Forsythia ovata]|uniref:BOI-related E3 ubiquitin-protein ligase n=1 Tax=Forsythia ovata TaxID=205694 RepID=A0ABD1U797_9LAMI